MIADGQRRARIHAKSFGRPSASIRLAGFMFAKISDIRAWSLFRADVIYSRTCSDRAHADLVAIDKLPAELLTMKANLADLLSFLPPETIGNLPRNGE